MSFPGIFGGVESDGRYLSHQNFGDLSNCFLEGIQGTRECIFQVYFRYSSSSFFLMHVLRSKWKGKPFRVSRQPLFPALPGTSRKGEKAKKVDFPNVELWYHLSTFPYF